MPKQPTIQQLAAQAGKLRDTLLKMSLRNTQTAKQTAAAPAPAPTRVERRPQKKPAAKVQQRRDVRAQDLGAPRIKVSAATLEKRLAKQTEKRPVPEHLKAYTFKAKKKG